MVSGRGGTVILIQILGALALLAGSALVLLAVWQADRAQPEATPTRTIEAEETLRRAA
jgi:hypothetical protein